MRKAKVIKEHKDYPELKLDDIVYVHSIEGGSAESQTPPSILIESQDGTLIKILIDICGKVLDLFQMVDEPNQLSKETQVQAILFEGQCRLNAMLVDNKQREIADNDVFNFSWDDFMALQEEIQKRIKDLK